MVYAVFIPLWARDDQKTERERKREMVYEQPRGRERDAGVRKLLQVMQNYGNMRMHARASRHMNIHSHIHCVDYVPKLLVAKDVCWM